MDALRFRLRVFMVIFCLIMLMGTLGFMVSEGLSPVDAFYFSLVTVTTVGYGDIHPLTPGAQGRLEIDPQREVGVEFIEQDLADAHIVGHVGHVADVGVDVDSWDH